MLAGGWFTDCLRKIQALLSYEYLGFKLEHTTVGTQKIFIYQKDIRTLNNFQKLLGDINWNYPSLGITNSEFRNLLYALNGDSALNSPKAELLKLKQFSLFSWISSKSLILHVHTWRKSMATECCNP